MPPIRILLLADTHLGLDLPAHPRVERRRRGDDFFANYRRALEPALRGEVDLVVHGGDVFFRSKIQSWLVQLAFEPLFEVAERVPVFVVPGNHERSAIPFPLLAAHRNVHLFDRPRTHRLEVRGETIAVAGFPYAPDVGPRFRELLARTGWSDGQEKLRLLCMHQTVEGARVGPVGFTFRAGVDVVRGGEIPDGLTAVLSGHIHRQQVLTKDLAGRALQAPVLYPGSIERTSRAERDEKKGYLLLEVDGGVSVGWRFVELPARPMVVLELEPLGGAHLRERIAAALARLDPNAVVRLRIEGVSGLGVTDATIRSLAPPSMNVELAGWDDSGP
ncbi:MAG TPA: metallophosphoesterase [Myxococcales bacterium]|jgi:DNA repair exonuclease SbcCD nuclease subunit